jgi:ATP-dependent Clp protease ATP-binding subunit ClpA
MGWGGWFTEETLQLLETARAIAAQAGAAKVDGPHLMAAFVRSPAPHAAALLEAAEIPTIFRRIDPPDSPSASPDQGGAVPALSYTPSAKRVLEGAMFAARDGFRMDLCTGDLLVSLIDQPEAAYDGLRQALGVKRGNGASLIAPRLRGLGGERSRVPPRLAR